MTLLYKYYTMTCCVSTQPLYVGSALSFYYCYDFCIFPGFSAELSYLMKFLPFLVTILLCIVVGVFRYVHKSDSPCLCTKLTNAPKCKMLGVQSKVGSAV